MKFWTSKAVNSLIFPTILYLIEASHGNPTSLAGSIVTERARGCVAKQPSHEVPAGSEVRKRERGGEREGEILGCPV